jgi:predicted GNAT superfamily acetyltransferase
MECLCSPLPPAPVDIVIRPYREEDRARLLALNAANQPAVTRMNGDDFTQLLAGGGSHLVACDGAGEVLGYLLSFPRGAAYEGTEFRHLHGLLDEPFFYIDQVVIDAEHRRRHIGRGLYRVLIEAARQRGVRVVCCEVNTNPPSLESLAFHHALGFGSLGAGTASNGMAIVYLAGWF